MASDRLDCGVFAGKRMEEQVKPFFDDGRIQIWHGDVLVVLREMPPESVHCVVTSPPFNGASLLADYVGADGKPYKVSADCPIHGLRRGSEIPRMVSCDVPPSPSRTGIAGTSSHPDQEPGVESVSTPDRDGGQLSREESPLPTPENMGDRRTYGHQTDDTQSLHHTVGTNEIPASSSGSIVPESASVATPRNSGTRKTARVPETTSPYTASGETPLSTPRTGEELGWADSAGRTFESNISQADSVENPSDRNQSRISGNVAQCNCTTITTDHFATFPEDLVKPCILAGCPAGGTVLDPFGGSMTTVLVARNLQCKGVAIELNEEYIEIGLRRLSQDVMAFA